MHIFRVLPVLSLLLGARASPVDSGDEVSRRLHARAAPSDVCLPVSPAGVAAGVDSQTLCVCYPFTGTLGFAFSTAEFVTAFNLAGLLLNPGTQGCAYPAFAIPSCTTATPCAYTCYTGEPSTGSNGLPSCGPQ